MSKLCPEPEAGFETESCFAKAKGIRVVSQPKPVQVDVSSDKAEKADGAQPRLYTPSEIAKLVTPDLQGLRRWE